MSKWRPAGWDKIKSELARTIDYEPSFTYEDRIVEASADAMLEILRAKGIRTDAFRANSHSISVSNPQKRGHYVFIPKEKDEKSKARSIR